MQFLILVLLFALLLTVNFIRRRRYRSLKHIRGPPSPSWVFGTSAVNAMTSPAPPSDSEPVGHDVALTRQEEVGELDFAWLKEYGPTWRIGGHLGVRDLCTRQMIPHRD